MLPGRAIEALDILEMGMISLILKLLTRNRYLLHVVDKASRF